MAPGTRAMNVDTCCPGYEGHGLPLGLPGSQSPGLHSSAELGALGKSSELCRKSTGWKPANQETNLRGERGPAAGQSSA